MKQTVAHEGSSLRREKSLRRKRSNAKCLRKRLSAILLLQLIRFEENIVVPVRINRRVEINEIDTGVGEVVPILQYL